MRSCFKIAQKRVSPEWSLIPVSPQFLHSLPIDSLRKANELYCHSYYFSKPSKNWLAVQCNFLCLGIELVLQKLFSSSGDQPRNSIACFYHICRCLSTIRQGWSWMISQISIDRIVHNMYSRVVPSKRMKAPLCDVIFRAFEDTADTTAATIVRLMQPFFYRLLWNVNNGLAWLYCLKLVTISKLISIFFFEISALKLINAVKGGSGFRQSTLP